MNDEDSKRAYGSADNMYRTFGRMLKRGVPPDSCEVLLREAKTAPLW